MVENLAHGDLPDLARHLTEILTPKPWRAAIVAATPRELADKLARLAGVLEEGRTELFDHDAGVFLGRAEQSPRIGFLFPGHAAPTYAGGGAFAQRFPTVRQLYQDPPVDDRSGPVPQDMTQPAIIRASIAGLMTLRRLGIDAHLALGHSLVTRYTSRVAVFSPIPGSRLSC